jgi:hypothetical protein
MSIFNLCVNFLLLLTLGCSEGDLQSKTQTLEVNKTKVNKFQGKIMRSVDDGKTWDDISEGLPQNLNINAVLVSSGQAYIGSSKSELYVNQSAPRNTWLTENLKEMYIHKTDESGYSVVGIFETSTAYYANVIYDALYKKIKGSNQWIPIKLPTGLNVVNEVKEDHHGNLYITGQHGVYISNNNGMQWTHIFNHGWIDNIVLQNDIIVISGIGGLHRSENMGKTWSKLSIAKPNANSLIVEKDKDHNYQLFTLGKELAIVRSDYPNKNAGNGKLQVSSDGGLTWHNHTADIVLQKLEGISNVTLYNGILYCSSIDGINSSADGGHTWYPVLQYKNNQPNMSIKLYHDGKTFYAIEQNMGC